jgi:uncharacterized protein (TIGR02265 family)
MKSEKPSAKKMVGGKLLEQTIDFLRMIKGDEAVRKLEKTQGMLLFDHMRFYPLSKLLRLQETVVVAGFGAKKKEEGYRALGRYIVEMLMKGIVGPTLTKISPSVKELLSKEFINLGKTVVNFGERKLVRFDAQDNVAVLEISDDPREPAYFAGVVEELLSRASKGVTTKVIDRNKTHYSIEVRWK